jgi:hypothetical protein
MVSLALIVTKRGLKVMTRNFYLFSLLLIGTLTNVQAHNLDLLIDQYESAKMQSIPEQKNIKRGSVKFKNISQSNLNRLIGSYKFTDNGVIRKMNITSVTYVTKSFADFTYDILFISGDKKISNHIGTITDGVMVFGEPSIDSYSAYSIPLFISAGKIFGSGFDMFYSGGVSCDLSTLKNLDGNPFAASVICGLYDTTLIPKNRIRSASLYHL